MNDDLSQNECVPCKGGIPPLSGYKLSHLMEHLSNDWKLVDEHHLEKKYGFQDFQQALAFTNIVGEIANAQDHHPDIHLSWGLVKVIIWTHKIDGLTESDFFFAAKCDAAL